MNENTLNRQKGTRWILLILGVILLLFLGLIYGWSVFRGRCRRSLVGLIHRPP